MANFFARYPFEGDVFVGTVTSVGLADGSSTPIYTISGSPVTGAGTLTFTLNTESANTVFAGPTSGGAAQPTFRALVIADIPSLSSIYLPLAGGTMSGVINMGSHKITSVTDPTSAQDAATKNYVDIVASSLTPIQATYAATTGSNIVGTYNNGAAGVGATFTVTATGAFTLDGTTPPANSRILIKDQTSGFQNGVYSLTTAGSIGVSPVLTRTTDYNTTTEMNAGTLIPVINGTVNALTSWLQTATITTIGTDSLVFVQWTANPGNYLLKANNLSDVASKSTSFNNLSPMTTGGDIIYGGASGAGTRLANGSSGQILTSAGGTSAPSWATGGNLTDAGTDGIVVTGGTAAVLGSGTSIAQHVADTTHNGYLSSTDWNTFNGKLTSTLASTDIFVGNGSNVATAVAMSGDATLANTGAITFATVNSNVGSFGSSTAIPSFTVNGKGLVTAASTNVVIAPAGTLTGTTLASNVVTSSLTTVGTIGTGVWNGTAITVPFGGTGDTTFTAYAVLCGGTTSTGVLQNVSGLGTSGQLLTSNGAGALPTWQAPAASGTVTSVALSVPAILSVSGSPITSSGTLAVTLANESANLVFAGPSSGGATTPTFRALVTADMPAGTGTVTSVAATVPAFLSISGSPVTTSGTLAFSLSGTALPLANGGTGQTTKAAAFDALQPMTTGGDIIYGGASGTGTRLANGSSGQVLTSAGSTSAPTWSTPSTGSYAQAYFGSASSWSTSSATYTDPTNAGGNTLTVRQHANITVTAAASNVCGITFTPANSSAVYKVTVSTSIYNSVTTSSVALRLTDGTTVISEMGGYAESGGVAATQDPASLTGIFVPGTGSAVTIKLQMAANAGTANMASNSPSTVSVEWTVLRIA